MSLFVIHECSWAIIASKFKDKTTRQCRRRLVRFTMIYIYMVLLMSSSSIGTFSPYKRKKQDMVLCFVLFFVLMLISFNLIRLAMVQVVYILEFWFQERRVVAGGGPSLMWGNWWSSNGFFFFLLHFNFLIFFKGI